MPNCTTYLEKQAVCMYLKFLLFNVTPLLASEPRAFCSLHPFTRHNLGMFMESFLFFLQVNTEATNAHCSLPFRVPG
ncbi:mCG116000 [Mus musculus]|nr:mCG116000 [Mus musculus]